MSDKTEEFGQAPSEPHDEYGRAVEESSRELTIEQWIELTEELVELAERYSEKEEDKWDNEEERNLTDNRAWYDFSEIRNDLVIFINELRNKANDDTGTN